VIGRPRRFSQRPSPRQQRLRLPCQQRLHLPRPSSNRAARALMAAARVPARAKVPARAPSRFPVPAPRDPGGTGPVATMCATSTTRQPADAGTMCASCVAVAARRALRVIVPLIARHYPLLFRTGSSALLLQSDFRLPAPATIVGGRCRGALRFLRPLCPQDLEALASQL
jgi:hypothetical protein